MACINLSNTKSVSWRFHFYISFRKIVRFLVILSESVWQAKNFLKCEKGNYFTHPPPSPHLHPFIWRMHVLCSREGLGSLYQDPDNIRFLHGFFFLTKQVPNLHKYGAQMAYPPDWTLRYNLKSIKWVFIRHKQQVSILKKYQNFLNVYH
jgi:hypothetical protein